MCSFGGVYSDTYHFSIIDGECGKSLVLYGEAVMQRKWRRVYDPNKRRERYAKEQAFWHEQEQLAVAHMMADVDGSLPHRMADEPLKEARREGLPTLAGAGAWPSIYHPAFAAPLWSQWWSPAAPVATAPVAAVPVAAPAPVTAAPAVAAPVAALPVAAAPVAAPQLAYPAAATVQSSSRIQPQQQHVQSRRQGGVPADLILLGGAPAGRAGRVCLPGEVGLIGILLLLIELAHTRVPSGGWTTHRPRMC